MNTLDSRLAKLKVIPVIVVDEAEDILPIGKALSENGLPVAEITFRTAAAADAIVLLRKEYPDMLIGAGTILNEQQLLAAKEAGVDFVVSAGLNPTTVKAAQKHNVAIIAGVNTPSLVEQAMELGLTTVKFFPAEASGGIKMLKAMLAPYNQIKVMPTGGINKDNIQAYLDVPSVLACGGSWMVDQSLVKNKEWDKMATLIREIVAQLK
ncbi:bifunctional 4-hydroxy-2-oxoglutarate aldolase/2-dehydro-3-deoxy-phosphogluconate aldolase [Vibrio sp. DW001]|uniref:bifunctional 4-hydroxy-2-oxoglutarate aldolase/2-dehydro-3-deoxy-phosphogluconate aldolase n=1 Tax=Vibrio sp. DW001 TaxID=2912315 RepID=UPI0023B121E1|nr:bifunctional 4-hydroxy-2-oxoglutarate aldolase/2-dehydro-3-deoxy-phosphogluconate aldolase [Vibrio sp. DW001]WED26312.1 bifunctional 4-hydroxy-2-oxoglutarate aldolase/2-dehydro-3-deoxy-phosphogluconate aldolase [Vibrio sp. DW001]